MNRILSILRYLRLTTLFALCIFVILCITMLFAIGGALLFEHVGLIPTGSLHRFPLFMFGIACILIGTLLALLFSKVMLRPLRNLMAATDRIADGDFSVRLDLRGSDEFRQLGRKFNHMAEELGSIEMLRSDFVNNFSHEFKTPIVSIRGFARALKWDQLTDAEREEYLDIIINESERLVSLSTNVLYLSKIESQSILSDKRMFNLSEQIRLVIALLDQKLTDKQLNIELLGDEVQYSGNEEMLKQVWINLLDNAIKFSPEGGSIEVDVWHQDDTISVRFRDHGIGMTPEQQEHIFDKFYQGDLSHSTSGNGLGLSIVRKIIELHDGGIMVHSSDQGSTFEVLLKAPLDG